MAVLSQMDIVVTAEAVFDVIRGGEASREVWKEAEKAVARGKHLWRPRAVYEWLDVISVEGGEVLFFLKEKERYLRLKMGASASMLKEARQALVAVYTIGSELDREVAGLTGSGRYLESYICDTAGMVALDKAGDRVKEVAETEAAKREWGVSPVLSPGSVEGWPLEGQIDLCSVLPMERIHMTLNEQGTLSPFRSVSCVIGIGPGYDTAWVGSSCRICVHSETCRISRNRKKEGPNPI